MLRDVSNGLHSATGNGNRLTTGKVPSNPTVGYQNENRNWELFKDDNYVLLESFGQQAQHGRTKFKIKSKISLLYGTTITFCLSLFAWAKYIF